jgi:hypothetical protein
MPLAIVDAKLDRRSHAIPRGRRETLWQLFNAIAAVLTW